MRVERVVKCSKEAWHTIQTAHKKETVNCQRHAAARGLQGTCYGSERVRYVRLPCCDALDERHAASRHHIRIRHCELRVVAIATAVRALGLGPRTTPTARSPLPKEAAHGSCLVLLLLAWLLLRSWWLLACLKSQNT